MYGYQCECCNGTVKPKLIEREAFKHKKGFVILESIVIGVCNQCGNRYYNSDLLHTVHAIATGRTKPERTIAIPVGNVATPSAIPAM